MTAEIRNDVIVATERIEAPPEVVFPYFTDPALIVMWIGDRAELDPQAGGVFSLDMGQVTARGAYITVDPPYRVAFSWGIPGSGTLPPGGSTVEVVLTPDGDGTMVVLTHRGLRAADIGTHRAGWEHRLGLLRVAVGLGGPEKGLPARCLPRADWGDRKRMLASAWVWTCVTSGEHGMRRDQIRPVVTGGAQVMDSCPQAGTPMLS